ncbi:MAG: hypothetical protein K0Q49_1972 [Haloplasmataceae bacterium]|jgi:hypothetical protein|nr:hypothetical protein [Haloplasmataceae bacterium]
MEFIHGVRENKPRYEPLSRDSQIIIFDTITGEYYVKFDV